MIIKIAIDNKNVLLNLEHYLQQSQSKFTCLATPLKRILAEAQKDNKIIYKLAVSLLHSSMDASQ